jgi:hypothetical protein
MRALVGAFRELVGAPLTTGRIASIALERTKDRKDYNAIFTKEAMPGLLDVIDPSEKPAAEPRLADAGGGDAGAHETRLFPEPDEESGLAAEARELVTYFHRTAHGVEPSRPKRKEVRQAEALIRDEGSEAARYIVDYALAEARRTAYPIQVFGFVLQYADRARTERTRSEHEESEADTHCTMCRGRGRIVFQRVDGSETIVGCPHDLEVITSWERTRGLTFTGAESGS